MRLNLEDEDFKAWVGKVFETLASGSANMGQEKGQYLNHWWI